MFRKKVTRKEFLKLAGLGIVGMLVAKPLLKMFSKKREPAKAETYGSGAYGGVRR